MGQILSRWRWLFLWLGGVILVLGVYTAVWNPEYTALQAEVRTAVGNIESEFLKSQMFAGVVLSKLLPAGLLGFFAIYMIGASVSTDDSYYHAWGSIFLQDVVMPFRKKPFTPQAHLKYLRWSIVGMGLFAFTFSCIWELKDYIQMWFQITATIYVGGAACAIIGGLYWKRGTTAGAWAGMVSGMILSLGGIVFNQMYPDAKVMGYDIDGLRVAVFAALTSFSVYGMVSLLTCKNPFNLDRLLHRGEYTVESDSIEESTVISRVSKALAITKEFSRLDKFIYYFAYAWTIVWALVFVIGTIWNMTHDVSTEAWVKWWTFQLGIEIVFSSLIMIWFTIGGSRDIIQLFRGLKEIRVNERDDGRVSGDHQLADEVVQEKD